MRTYLYLSLSSDSASRASLTMLYLQLPLINPCVQFSRTRLSNLIRFICLKSVKCKAVFVGIYRHGSDSKLVRCPEDPYRYFTTVGNEKPFEFSDFHKKPLPSVS